MLQQEKPEDFVIATGKQYSVRQFVLWTAQELGIELNFEGKGLNEKAIVMSVRGDSAHEVKPGDCILRIDPRYYRPTEVDTLLGDASKARRLLGWEPEIDAQTMCKEMVAMDLKGARKQALLSQHGYVTHSSSD